MTQKTKFQVWRQRMLCAIVLVITGAGGGGALLIGRAAAAACPTPTTDYGTVATTVSVPAAATYRIWTHMLTSVAANNAYNLEIDASQCAAVGGSTLTANAWTWVDYQNGNTASAIDVPLSAGTHNLKLIGTQSGVEIDQLVLTSDLSCVPTGGGDNCNVPADVTPPVVALAAPANGATVSGTIPLTATASDNSGANGIAKVEFYVNSTLQSTITTAPYGTTWNTASAANGDYTITAKAYDQSGNYSSSAHIVTVNNSAPAPAPPPSPGTQKPSAPAQLTAQAVSYQQVNLKWQPSSGGSGALVYNVYRASGFGSARKVATTSSTSIGDTGLQARTRYTYYIVAEDAAGNASAKSNSVSLTTPAKPRATTFRGSVTGTRQKPLSNAKVTVSGGGKHYTYRTGNNGRYAITALAPGTYNVSYSAHGYRTQHFTLRLSSSQAITKNISLRK